MHICFKKKMFFHQVYKALSSACVRINVNTLFITKRSHEEIKMEVACKQAQEAYDRYIRPQSFKVNLVTLLILSWLKNSFLLVFFKLMLFLFPYSSSQKIIFMNVTLISTVFLTCAYWHNRISYVWILSKQLGKTTTATTQPNKQNPPHWKS